MGSNATASGTLKLTNPVQKSVTVYATNTYYVFQAGGVEFNVTFTTPALTSDIDLLAQPVTYITFSASATDGNTHSVQAYFDFTGEVITNSILTPISWNRYNFTSSSAGGMAALRIGATTQTPLQCCDDRISWGYAYGVTSNDPSQKMHSVLYSSDVTRASFAANGSIPSADDPTPSRIVSI